MKRQRRVTVAEVLSVMYEHGTLQSKSFQEGEWEKRENKEGDEPNRGCRFGNVTTNTHCISIIVKMLK
jgi:hypothetical protein